MFYYLYEYIVFIEKSTCSKAILMNRERDREIEKTTHRIYKSNYVIQEFILK